MMGWWRDWSDCDGQRCFELQLEQRSEGHSCSWKRTLAGFPKPSIFTADTERTTLVDFGNRSCVLVAQTRVNFRMDSGGE